MDLLHSPLHDRHVALGAKFAEFGGWEHAAGVRRRRGAQGARSGPRRRRACSTSAISARPWCAVPGAAAFVNACLTNDLGRIQPGQGAVHAVLRRRDGGVVDDLIAYLRSDDEVFLIPNAANTAEVVAPAARRRARRARGHQPAPRPSPCWPCRDPLSDEVLSALGLPVDHEYMSFADGTVAGHELTVCRTGYTGERGYELVVPSEGALDVWDALVEAGEPHGIRPAGSAPATRCAPRWATRCTATTCRRDHPGDGRRRLGGRLGQARVLGQGGPDSSAPRSACATIRGLLAQGRGIPRPGMTVVSDDGTELGEITSGTFSPTLRTASAWPCSTDRSRPGRRSRSTSVDAGSVHRHQAAVRGAVHQGELTVTRTRRSAGSARPRRRPRRRTPAGTRSASARAAGSRPAARGTRHEPRRPARFTSRIRLSPSAATLFGVKPNSAIRRACRQHEHVDARGADHEDQLQPVEQPGAAAGSRAEIAYSTRPSTSTRIRSTRISSSRSTSTQVSVDSERDQIARPA